MICQLLMTSAFSFVIPIYVSTVLGHYTTACVLYLLLITSICNHGNHGQNHAWCIIDRCYAYFVAIGFLFSALWLGLFRGSKNNIMYLLAGCSGLLAGLFYCISRGNRGQSKGMTAHAYVHVSGALAFTLFTIAQYLDKQ